MSRLGQHRISLFAYSSPTVSQDNWGLLWEDCQLGKSKYSLILSVIDVSCRWLLGLPVGGAIFARFGYRGPFILAITWTAIDLTARLLIIERKEALQYGIDPQQVDKCEDKGKQNDGNQNSIIPDRSTVKEPVETNPTRKSDVPPLSCSDNDKQRKPSYTYLLVMFLKLTKSSRALVACMLTFAYGYV